MDAILNNPFRILGLPTTASDKEIAKRVSDLLIYAEMGKKVSYETDFPFLGELDRSVDAIKLAAKRIELPENKIFYSLLCFDLKDNFERESIEFIKQEDFISAYNLLNKTIDENSPNDFITWQGKDQISLLKKIGIVDNDDYSIQKAIHPSNSDIATSIFNSINKNKNIIIKSKYGIDIIETNSQISFTDKYQISCKFKWISPLECQNENLGLRFTNYSNEKYLVSISPLGKLSIKKSNILEFEKVIDEDVFNKKKLNRLAIQRFDKYIEIKLNEKSIYKIETNEIFQSFTLCFLGRQIVLIDDLFISGLTKKELGTGAEINEKIFSYKKNYAIIFLLNIVNSKKIGSNLFSYLDIIGSIFKEPYFIIYTKEVIAKNYICDFTALTDIFIREFYFSLNNLVDPTDEILQSFFISSFGKLPGDSQKKVQTLALGNKLYNFENFIKEISSKRNNAPVKACDFASNLKNEAIIFFNWYFQIYDFWSLESKSISDKIGNEILECAIAYYNASTPRTIEHAKVALKVLTWASDFAFNQQLRERINKSISIIINSHPNTDYKIVDFEFKDRTRTSRRITPKDKPADPITNKVPPQKTNNNQPTTTSAITNKQAVPEQSKKLNERKRKISKSIFKNAGGLFLIMLPIIAMIYLVVAPDFSGNTSLRNQENIPKATENQIDNNLPIQSKSKLNIDLSNYESKEQQSETIQKSKWQGNKLQNGDSPYDGAFGRGVYDSNSKCYLIFKNGNSTDAIVCIENTATGRTIRNEYIQAGTDYKMTNIPEGVYKVKSFYGNDWNPEKTLNQGAIKGAFDTDLGFSVSDKTSDLIQMSITETNEGISYTTGEITLYTVSNGNMNQRNINSDEFFK